jgi:hypothetical protein
MQDMNGEFNKDTESLKNNQIEALEMKNFFFLIFVHLFTCAYIVWAISPPCPPHFPLLPPTPACFQAEPVLPFSPILLKKRHKQ